MRVTTRERDPFGQGQHEITRPGSFNRGWARKNLSMGQERPIFLSKRNLTPKILPAANPSQPGTYPDIWRHPRRVNATDNGLPSSGPENDSDLAQLGKTKLADQEPPREK